MTKMLTEYDYEPGEPVDYVTLIIYYQSLSQKNDSAEIYFLDILLWLCTYKHSYNILGLCHFSCLR